MRALLSRPAFRNLWIGQTVSSVGDSMVIVVLALYVTELTGSATDVGFVLAAYSLPLVGFLLLGGVVADRLPRRAVMIGSDAVRAVLHGTLALLIVLDAVEVWHMVVIGLLFGVAKAFFMPAYTGLVPQTVDEDEIQVAQAASGISREGSLIAGPALGTVLFLGVGPASAFAVDALTFVVSIGFLLAVHPRERGAPSVRSTVLREMREGWHAVRERAWVWVTIVSFSIAILVALAPYFTLGASIAQDEYGRTTVFGYVQISWGVGTVIGTVWGANWKPRYPMRAAMLCALPWPISSAIFGLGAPLAITLAATTAAGLGLGLFTVWWETALAERIPPHLLSRVSSYDWMGSLALIPIGYVLAGVIGDAVGASETMLVGSAIAFVALLAGLLPRETRMLE